MTSRPDGGGMRAGTPGMRWDGRNTGNCQEGGNVSRPGMYVSEHSRNEHSRSVSEYFEWQKSSVFGTCKSAAGAFSMDNISSGKHGYSFVISSLLFHCSSSSA